MLLKLIDTPKTTVDGGLVWTHFLQSCLLLVWTVLHLISGCYTLFSKLLEGCLPHRDGGRRRVLGMV